jgi:hypothetical protein
MSVYYYEQLTVSKKVKKFTIHITYFFKEESPQLIDFLKAISGPEVIDVSLIISCCVNYNYE